MYDKTAKCTGTLKGFSYEISVLKGVHQGYNLSPTLFNIVINDIPHYMSWLVSLCSDRTTQILYLLYAEDIVLSPRMKTGLQRSLNPLHMLQEMGNE